MTSTEGRIRIDPGALALDEKNPSKKSARHHVQNVQNLMLSMEQSVKQLFFLGITFKTPLSSSTRNYRFGLNGNGVFLKFPQCLEFGSMTCEARIRWFS